LPSTLSGGQKQRVSLCRALMNRPKLLLLDEPLSALDATMRLKLQDEILQLHKEFGTTTIMVSHDASEIYRLASRVLVLEGGKIVKDGSVKELMLKEDNVLEGELLELREDNMATVLVGQQLIEVTFSKEEAQMLEVGDFINLTAHKNL
ncbi:MAG: Molybdenum transport ATP-binding protein ModC (TC 3.A.1.8.1), partial [uncultured Sulfurovum sp.]